MATVKVRFEKCIQDSHEYGTTDDMMVSRVFFTVEVVKTTGQVERYSDLYANVKQAAGRSFEDSAIEVEYPCDRFGDPYEGPMNYQRFRNATQGYFRSLVGSMGAGIHVHRGSNIWMRKNTFVRQYAVEFEADD